MLSLVATPIGNLGDITLRALEVLREAQVIACEDTRRTRALLGAHGIPAPRLVACDERREARVAPGLVELAIAGTPVAFASDAGMPTIADPGRELVRVAIAAGCPLQVLPGPSAVSCALALSGLAADGFVFAGWVPRRAGERARALARETSLPVVWLEAPTRAAATLAAAAKAAPERPAALCRELTKLHEEVMRGTTRALADALEGRELRGEVVLVLGVHAHTADHAPALEAARALAAAGATARVVAEVVSGLTGAPRRELYDAAASSRRHEPQT
jgi:16S rRNA (cytidine1402-2'-O)-methyltransferase